MPDQDKMIVTQARHMWACSKFAAFFENDTFKDIAYHGYKFLRDKMWDQKYGGFYTMRRRERWYFRVVMDLLKRKEPTEMHLPFTDFQHYMK